MLDTKNVSILLSSPLIISKILCFANFNIKKPWKISSASASTLHEEKELFTNQLKRLLRLSNSITSIWKQSYFPDDDTNDQRNNNSSSFLISNKTTLFPGISSEAADSVLRKILETIAQAPLQFSRAKSFRRHVLNLLVAVSSSSSSSSASSLICSKLKLPLQHRLLSHDKKTLAVAIGKEIFFYPQKVSSNEQTTSPSVHHFEFKELGSVRPKTAKAFLDDDDDPNTNDDQNLNKKTDNSTSKNDRTRFCAYRSCFSPDSRMLAVSCLDGSIRFGDARSGQLKATLFIQRGLQNQAQKRRQSRSSSGYDLSSLGFGHQDDDNNNSSSKRSNNAEPFFIEALCFSGDSRFLFFCAGTKIYVAEIFDEEDFLEPKIVQVWKEEDEEEAEAETQQKEKGSSKLSHYYINNLTMVLPKRNILISCNGDDCSMSIFDVLMKNQSNSMPTTTTMMRRPGEIAEEEIISIIKFRQKIKLPDRNSDWIRDICFTRDNERMFTVGNDKTIRCYDIIMKNDAKNNNDSSTIVVQDSKHTKHNHNNHQSKHSPSVLTTDHKSKIFTVSISSDSKLLATGSTDGDVRIFDIESWKEKKDMILKGDGFGLLTCLAFPPPSFHQHHHHHSSNNNKKNKDEDDSAVIGSNSSSTITFLVTGSHLNIAKFWSINSAKNESQCFKVINFDSSILSIAFSPLNSDSLVFTDYYGARRFFSVVKWYGNTNRNDNVEKITLKDDDQFPVVRMQFVRNNDDENDDDKDHQRDRLFVEDLMGNTFVF